MWADQFWSRYAAQTSELLADTSDSHRTGSCFFLIDETGSLHIAECELTLGFSFRLYMYSSLGNNNITIFRKPLRINCGQAVTAFEVTLK